MTTSRWYIRAGRDGVWRYLRDAIGHNDGRIEIVWTDAYAERLLMYQRETAAALVLEIASQDPTLTLATIADCPKAEQQREAQRMMMAECVS